MALSSNSIIHFTNTKDKIKGILTNNFKINYCKEKIYFKPTTFVRCAVPMVSFCDIPLSEVKNHLSNYGPYGIGLTKSWAEKRGLNPVLYLEKRSSLAKNYLNIYQHYILESQKQVGQFTGHEKSVVDLMRYMKNYQGELVRNGNIIKEYRFSDEREWRYVPSITEKLSMILAEHDYDTKEKEKKANKSLQKLRLEFEPSDIKYIIIENDSEISEFLELLRISKGKKYSYQEVERLMTRLLNTEQIVTDF